MSRLLLTGFNGFTGVHLLREAAAQGFKCFALDADITNANQVREQVAAISPSHVIHLAGISAVTHHHPLDFYQVNVLGSQNLLEALAGLSEKPQKIIMASSANVYGHVDTGVIGEDLEPRPVNHYAISKLAMELMAATFGSQLPIVNVRPFNYTGVGHDTRFVIPKIIVHFKSGAATIELGNLNVEREYNDVRTVCQAYMRLLAHGEPGQTYNLCSGRAITIRQIIDLMQQISGHKIQVKINPAFVRTNEIAKITGNPEKLKQCVGDLNWPPLIDTLSWMYSH